MPTKSQFLAYEAVRKSGVTNMLHINEVRKLTGLPMYELLTIINNYDALKAEHGTDVSEGEVGRIREMFE